MRQPTLYIIYGLHTYEIFYPTLYIIYGLHTYEIFNPTLYIIYGLHTYEIFNPTLYIIYGLHTYEIFNPTLDVIYGLHTYEIFNKYREHISISDYLIQLMTRFCFTFCIFLSPCSLFGFVVATVPFESTCVFIDSFAKDAAPRGMGLTCDFKRR